LGTRYKCHYTESAVLHQNPDVQIISSSGKKFGINRTVLACSSPVCHDLMVELYACPLANSEEVVHISTDFDEAEVESIMNFFFTGALPVRNEKLDAGLQPVFHALGLDLNYLAEPGISIKAEPVEPDLSVYEGPIGDYFGEDDYYGNDGYDGENKPILPLQLQAKKKRQKKIIEDMENSVIPNLPMLTMSVTVDKPGKKRAAASSNKKGGGSGAKKIKKAVKKEEEDDESYDEDGTSPTKQANGEKKTRNRKSKEDPKTFFYFPLDIDRDLDLKYQCRRCHRGFNELYDYRQHYLRHDLGKEDPSKAFACLRCYQFFSSNKKEVLDHGKDGCTVKRHEDDKSSILYYCIYCPDGGTDLETSIEWLQHMKRRHPEQEARLFREHVCSACGKGWKGDYLLEKHRKQEGPFHRDECNTCGMPVSSWEEHQKHIKEKHDGKWVYKCGLCGVCKFETEEEERGHRKFCKHSQATGPLPKAQPGYSTCTICFEVVDNASLVVRSHFLEFHPSILKKCPLCDKRFFDQKGKESHISYYHKQRLQCDQCDRTFAIKHQLKTHKIDVHTPKALKPYVCKCCELVFDSKFLLTKHSAVHRTKPVINKIKKIHMKVCDQCGNEVPTHGYKDHMQRFHGTEHIKCKDCTMTFKHERIYLQHYERVHIFVTCEECGEQVGSKNMKRHKLAKHTAEHLKPYLCRICEPLKGFLTRMSYEEHCNIHTGARPYVCNYCTKNFSNHSNKRKHIVQSHRELEMAAVAAAEAAKQ